MIDFDQKIDNKTNQYIKNFSLLSKKYPLLAQKIEAIKNNQFETNKYIVDQAKSGSYTLAILHNSERIQIHSKYDPVKESVSLLRSFNIKNHKIIVMLGIGLGYHANTCYEEYKNSVIHYFVIEPDINIFLKCLEYNDISNLILSDNVSLIVGLEEEILYKYFYELLQKLGAKVQLFLKAIKVIELPSLTRIYSSYYHAAVVSFRQAAETILTNYGNCPKDAIDGVSNLIINIPQIVKNPGINQAFNLFLNKPGILVSTGPSLDKNVKELSKAVNKSIIVCADSALQVLYNYGIKPDLVVSVERLPEVADLFKPIPSDWRNDIWLVALPLVVPEVYSVWSGPKLIAYRNFAHFEWIDIPKGSLPVGPSCANLGFQVLKAFGCNPIILVGQDCSFKDANKTHASGASGVTKLDLSNAQLYKVKGNIEDWVYTDHIFDLYRKTFVVDIANFNGVCINATEGGAYIDGTIIMPLAEAISKYCKEHFNAKNILIKKVKLPTDKEIQQNFKKFLEIAKATINEIEYTVQQCNEGEKYIKNYKNELDKIKNSLANSSQEFYYGENFINQIPIELLETFYKYVYKTKVKILSCNKYFEQYLMHILQPIIISYELSINEIPVIYPTKKEQMYYSLQKMEDWFSKVKEICLIALNVLKSGYEKIKNSNY